MAAKAQEATSVRGRISPAEQVLVGSLDLASSLPWALARRIIITVDPRRDAERTIRSLIAANQFAIRGPLTSGRLESTRTNRSWDRELEASSPVLAGAVHAVIAEYERDSGDIDRLGAAVFHAVRANRFDLVANVLAHYGESIDLVHPGIWDRALRDAPEAALEEHPALAQLAAALDGPNATWSRLRRAAQSGLQRLPTLPPDTCPRERAFVAADAVLGHRLAGDYGRALRLGREELARLRARPRESNTSAVSTMRLLIETAKSAQLSGESAQAEEMYEAAYDRVRLPHGAALGLVSAGELALMAATNENGPAADVWMQRAREFQAHAPAGAPLHLDAPLKLASALRAASTFDIEVGRRIVDELRRRDPGMEHWPYLLLADARIATLEGRAAHAIVRYTSTLHAAHRNLPKVQLDNQPSQDLLSFLSLANGQVSATRNTLERSQDEQTAHGRLLLTVIALHDNDHEATRIQALRLTKHPSLSIVARACMLAANAYLDAGKIGSAQESFTWGHLTARELDTVQPYLWIRATARRELADLTGTASTLAALFPPEQPGMFDRIDHNIRFTHREFQVLALMNENLKRREIAERLFVTDQTVKGFIASIYKKLNVRTREAALTRAREVDILGHAGPEQ